MKYYEKNNQQRILKEEIYCVLLITTLSNFKTCFGHALINISTHLRLVVSLYRNQAISLVCLSID